MKIHTTQVSFTSLCIFVKKMESGCFIYHLVRAEN